MNKLATAAVTFMLLPFCANAGARPLLTAYSEDTAAVVAGDFAPELQRRFYAAAVEIAIRKMREGERRLAENPPKREILPRISTGGGFDGLFLWDTCFCVMWAKYEPSIFPVLSSLDNFYNLQEPDGFICREFSYDGTPAWSKDHPVSWNPPLLSWAEWELFESGISDATRLEKVYPALKRFYLCCEKSFRRPDGLYFGDRLGGGMDDLPRYPKTEWDPSAGIQITRECLIKYKDWYESAKDELTYKLNRQMGWVDMTSQMALNAMCMAKIAHAIGLEEDSRLFRAKHAELARLVNEKCWDEERGFYFDHYDGAIVPRYSVAGLWPLVARIVPRERVARVVAVLKDEAIFNRPVPVPALGACEAEYDPEGGYWRGSSWPCTTYMVLRGLRACRQEELARELARRYYNANLNLFLKTGTIWENISPEQCAAPKRRACNDFTGWGALAPIAIYHEFIKGQE